MLRWNFTWICRPDSLDLPREHLLFADMCFVSHGVLIAIRALPKHQKHETLLSQIQNNSHKGNYFSYLWGPGTCIWSQDKRVNLQALSPCMSLRESWGLDPYNNPYMSHSLNSMKGGYIGGSERDYYTCHYGAY